MKILKFGGSSVGSPERIKQVISIINDYYNDRTPTSVVFSAFQGVTDQLVSISNKALLREDYYHGLLQELRLKHFEIADALIYSSAGNKLHNELNVQFDKLKDILHGIYLLKELTPRILDSILSFGERLSCSIITAALIENNIDCEMLDSSELIKTDHNFGNAKVNFKLTNKNITGYFNEHSKIQVITGFTASTENDEITTLGRGGSDYTAAIFGAALGAEEIEIWTDVNGIMTADPRRVKDALSLKAVTYQEAMEMSHFGAKVIYPPTLKPAFDRKIPVKIRNTFNTSFKGTTILEKEPYVKFNAKGISSVDNITLLRVEGSGLIRNENISSRMFNSLAEKKIKVLLLTQGSSGFSICIAVQPHDGNLAKKSIEKEVRLEIIDGQIREITKEENLAIIAVVGEDMHHTPGIAGKVFQALGKNGINIIAIAQGSSELNISFVINKNQLTKALNVLHDSLFLSQKKILNLFLIGPGLVGSALLDYIKRRKNIINKNLFTQFNLVGIANSKKMLFDDNGINLDSWKDNLTNSEFVSDAGQFVKTMKSKNLANTIFIDCTASTAAVPFYESILNSSISIATPNKIANTGSYTDYLKLREAAVKHNVQFAYSTNVGAGLPILNTLKDLVSCGEEIIKIEGVISGTLSYLFNSFSGDKKFSKIVFEAAQQGFTEPDPRDDLNGLDVARKLLILLRETGSAMELNDIVIENLVPENARGKISVSKFFKILEEEDEKFEKRKIAAEAKGMCLRYIAKYENGKAEVGLKEVNNDHPFFNLKGNDNIVSITTKNYLSQPLTIRGRGAGAEFTASGIFADILRISNYLS